MSWHGQGVCVDSRLGACYVSFVFVGRMGALGCARDHGKQCHGDVMCVVGRCGALEQRIAAACDLPVRRVALFSDEYSWHSI